MKSKKNVYLKEGFYDLFKKLLDHLFKFANIGVHFKFFPKGTWEINEKGIEYLPPLGLSEEKRKEVYLNSRKINE